MLTDATMDRTHWERLIKCNSRHNQFFVEGDKKGQRSHREAVTIRAVTWRLHKSHFLHSQRLLCRQSQTATTIMPHPPPASPGDNCQGGSRERMCSAHRHLLSQQTRRRARSHKYTQIHFPLCQATKYDNITKRTSKSHQTIIAFIPTLDFFLWYSFALIPSYKLPNLPFSSKPEGCH